MKAFNLVCALSILFVFTPKSWAVLDLIVRGEIKVYKKRSVNSKVISVLARGDRVVVSPKLYGQWRKVLITYQGKRQGGFIRNKDITLSTIEDRDQEDYNFFRRNNSFGININLIFELQAESDISVLGMDQATIGSRTGYDYYLGLDYHTPISSWGLLQFSLKRKSSDMEGNAELVPGGGRNMVDVRQRMYSFGSFLKFYKNNSSFFWKGFGIEFAKVYGLDIGLQDGAPLTYNDELPLYIIGNVGMGWDYKWKEKRYIIMEARGSVNFSATPMIYAGEAIVSVAQIF